MLNQNDNYYDLQPFFQKHANYLFATLKFENEGPFVDACDEQDHRFIKKITKPMMGFKAFHSAQATIAGIETAHMIRKGQLSEENLVHNIRQALVGNRTALVNQVRGLLSERGIIIPQGIRFCRKSYWK
jgi:hypothetical protein